MAAITVDKLAKRYSIGSAPTNSIRDALAGVFKPRNGGRTKTDFWALKDISFELEAGQTLGIIGYNGAGKSTLLKILSRITRPTSGRGEIRGRVGSLLEIGTGFHSELSGRENVYLNGAILGMRRVEIEAKFDEIVAFADIGEFLDTPVKHYSSGMFMRLAFAVAAHLDPEILIVDEVLAVGDINFQRKCLGKMQEVGQSGRTILFVSHDMAAVSRICDRAIVLSNGRIVASGPSGEAIGQYLAGTWGAPAERIFDGDLRAASDAVRLERVRVINKGHDLTSRFDIRDAIGLEITYQVIEGGHILLPNLQVFNQERAHVFTVQDVASDWSERPKDPGTYTSTAWIPGNLMAEGGFIVNAAIVTYIPSMIIHLNATDAVTFEVFDPMTGDTARGHFAGKMGGVVRPLIPWETEMGGTR
jgi:lipopolysaccharide transport system ATP-binding protein